MMRNKHICCADFGIVGRAIDLLNDPDFYRREETIKTCEKLLFADIFGILEKLLFREQRQYVEEILI